ncbi:hypothetical protein CPI27_08365 [Moraxella catarrhalis]|nr:hypothetical protein [Moraxella catarrhalis]
MQAGRIVATDGRQITLDRMAGKVGDTLMVGDNSAQIVQIDDTVITTDTAIGRAGQVFAISSSDVAPRAYRVMTISQNDDASFSFTALQYEIGKFTATNNIAAIPKKEVSVIKAHVLTPPNSVSITERTRTHQGQAITTLVISWEQVVGAVAYIVEYKKDSNAWQTHKVSSHSLEIDGVYAGAYQAKVRAIDAFDNESLATSSQLTQITGKQGKPPRPINLSVQGVLFGMNLGWNFARGSDDTNYTEIEVSPDGRSNIATLGTFAYPTNKHEITGLQGNLRQFYRARIVDKLGNTSDWTDWASGTTSANADKVLDMLSGQISQSHLDQSLRTPIGKIGTIESNINSFNSKIPSINKIPTLESAINSVNSKIPTIESNINSFNSKIPSINKIPTLESAVNSVNGNLSTLNSQLATAQNELSTAKSTLQIAVGNITTERNRITAAIFDINALQADKNAKTQEIANLTQTVGSHTSSIRELGVATGDLSQKYNQIKTQADNTNSEITAIKQTQSGQATSVERLGARFDNLSAGGRNLIINSGVVVQNDSYPIRSYPLAPNHGLADGDDVVITIWGQLADSKTAFYAYNSGGWVRLGRFSKISDGVYVLKTQWAVSLGVNTASNTALNIYPFPQSQIGESRIDKIKLERGNIATDWTAAPEDLQEQLTAQLANKASTASVNTLNQTLANKERALTEQINTAKSELANKASSADLQSVQRTLTSKERSLSQRINTLQSDYNGNKASVQSSINTLTTTNQSLSERINTVESSVSGNTSSINTLNQSLTTTNRALTTKQEQLTAQLANKASTSSVNSLTESLASKERALTEQINRAKSEIGGRITQISNETRTLTDANRTIGERINQLNSELAGADSISDNLLINSNRTLVTGAYLIATYRISETLKNGDKVRLTVNAPQLGSRRIGFMAYNSNSASGSKLSDIRNRQGNSYTAEFEWNVGTGANNELWLYHNAENTRSVSTITSVSLQKITTSSGLASIKSSVANLERTLTTTNQSLAERINTVQTTLNGQTASIQQHAQTLNGLSAQWTLKVQSGGIVSGIGLASNNGVSDFAVIADKFYVASPQGDKKPMFSVITRPTTINGTTVPAVVSLNGDLIGSGTISGDKIRANTQITAPNIRGGSISIGSNFSVDSQGNLNANSGVFRGQVLADKITGQIDVESLKSSAVALGYNVYISDYYHASEPYQFDKKFKATYSSHGSIMQSLGLNNESIGSVMFEMRVFCKRAVTVKQKIHTVDDNLYCYVNGDSLFGYKSVHQGYDDDENVPNSISQGRINREIHLSLRQGLNTIEFVLNNSGGGICQLIVLGDFIDNNIIKFA